jgi:hypothetical protein
VKKMNSKFVAAIEAEGWRLFGEEMDRSLKIRERLLAKPYVPRTVSGDSIRIRKPQYVMTKGL